MLLIIMKYICYCLVLLVKVSLYIHGKFKMNLVDFAVAHQLFFLIHQEDYKMEVKMMEVKMMEVKVKVKEKKKKKKKKK